MPTMRLSEPRQVALSALLALEPPSRGDRFPDRRALEALGQLIPSDVIGVGVAESDTGYVLRTVSIPASMGFLHAGTVGDGCAEGVLHELEDPRLRPLLGRTGMADGLLLGFRDGRDRVVQVWLDRRCREFSDTDIALLRMVAPLLRRLLREGPSSEPPAELTTQEHRVLQLVATGMSNAEAAARMSVAPCTVRKHLEHAFRKLGVSNRLAAVKAYEGPGAPCIRGRPRNLRLSANSRAPPGLRDWQGHSRTRRGPAMSIRRRLLVAAATTSLVLPLGAWPAPAQPPSSDAAAAAATAVAWQRIALRTIYTEGGTPPAAGTLYLAFTSRAVDDCRGGRAAAGRLRPGGRGHGCARRAQGVLRPTSSANLDADLASALAAIPDGPAEAKGVRIGERAAARMIEEPRGRRAQRPDGDLLEARRGGLLAATAGRADHRGRHGSGVARLRRPARVHCSRQSSTDPTCSPAAPTPSTTRRCWRRARPPRPPSWPTRRSRRSFFAFNPLVMYRTAVCDMLTASPMGLRATTRLFATIDTAVATAGIETSRLKFEIGFWRPFQAINDLRDDGNPATEPQQGWAPLVPNPFYSDYTSGHASATAPFAEVMRETFGDDVTLTLTRPNPSPAPPEVRTYTSLSDLEHDALHARIWGGLHFRDAMEDGYFLGHETARRVMDAIDY